MFVSNMCDLTEVFIVTSRRTDSNETTISEFCHKREESVKLMEDISLDALRKVRDHKGEVDIASPLNDTVSVNDLLSGYTIRRKEGDSNTIELWKIERRPGALYGYTRERTVVQYFKVISVKKHPKSCPCS